MYINFMSVWMCACVCVGPGVGVGVNGAVWTNGTRLDSGDANGDKAHACDRIWSLENMLRMHGVLVVIKTVVSKLISQNFHSLRIQHPRVRNKQTIRKLL